MRNKYRQAGFLFLVVMAVYFGQAIQTKAEAPAGVSKDPAGAVKVLDNTDPFGNAAPATEPASTHGTSASAPVVNVSNAGTVEIHVNDANLVEVLRMLSLQSQKNIIASKDVRGTITANLYDVTIREALDALLATNGYGYREHGNFIYVYSAKEILDMDKAARVVKTQAFRLYYTPAANAVTMIKPVLSTEAQVAFTTPASSGLDTGTKDIGGSTHATEDVVVVTDYPDNLERVAAILKEIDRRPQQILLEATILRATLSEDNALGIDFTLLGNVDFSTLNAAGASSATALSGTITSNSAASGILENGYSGAGTGFRGNVPSGGLQVGLVHNNIAVFLSALESLTDTTIVANPKILALNKQKGEVIVGRKDGYTTSTTTDTSTVQTIEFLDTGTRLIFRPFIGDDGYIRMEIHPEDSSGGLTSANLPFKITTETTSNVLVKDGHTIVIGGLFRESSQTSRAQVPGLGNLPGIGYLFRSQRDVTTREEIIILLTPHIIKDDAAYSALSASEQKEAEKLRIGVRRGMMPFGRERLAESFYDSAVKEMNKPDGKESVALWYLDSATNLNPKFSEAIDMKEKLTGETVTSVDNCTFRSFVKRQIMTDTAPPATQPAVQQAMFEPVKQLPATRPAMAESPTTRPAMVVLPTTRSANIFVWAPVEAHAAPPPGTQPSDKPATDPATTTTQLPLDDAAK
ncbi:hypothetical protein BH10PLA1_BH10PLA1_02560 [soil metagenome]